MAQLCSWSAPSANASWNFSAVHVATNFNAKRSKAGRHHVGDPGEEEQEGEKKNEQGRANKRKRTWYEMVQNGQEEARKVREGARWEKLATENKAQQEIEKTFDL